MSSFKKSAWKNDKKTKTEIPSFTLSESYKSDVCEKAYLGRRGYTIPKSILSEQDLNFLKEDLFLKAKPGINMGAPTDIVSFPVYRESPNKLYIPRFYGEKRYGKPHKSEISIGEPSDLQFTKTLRDYQTEIIDVYLNHVSKDDSIGGGGILEVGCGKGKCLGKDTPILMYDGNIKLVQDVRVGDVIMGDDSTPRNVLTLARGKEQMYKVIPKKGDPYIVNESHILSLKHKNTNEIKDICVLDYLSLNNRQDYLGYRAQIVFQQPPPKSLITPTNDIMVYEIDIELLDIDDYYGFEIDGNRRFVLGDFTVTHNTVMALNIISKIQKKTLILVHKEFLMNQWIERIGEFLPSARIGKIQGPKFEIDDRDIVLGMIQTMYSRDFPTGSFDSFGLTIIDEVHRIGSEEFSKTLLKTVTPYMLGISATVDRKDGLTSVLHMFIGDKIYHDDSEKEDPVIVRGIQFQHTDSDFIQMEYDFRGNPKYSTMISKLCDFNPRKNFIVKVTHDLLLENNEKQIMILAHNRSLLTYLHDSIKHKEIGTVGYYVGGMKEKALKETEEKQIVLATYAMAAEALDIKTLSTLIMATPKTDIEQSVGRILRSKHENPIVVDIIDLHDTFQNQWKTRKRFYKKCNYKIIHNTSGKYVNMENCNEWKVDFDPNASNGCAKKQTKKDTKEGGVCMIQLSEEEQTQELISYI
jgi:superfamily II DNA or RNA helicase